MGMQTFLLEAVSIEPSYTEIIHFFIYFYFINILHKIEDSYTNRPIMLKVVCDKLDNANSSKCAEVRLLYR